MTETLLAVITGKAKTSTKALFASFMTIGALLQVPDVNGFARALFHAHPHVSSFFVTLAAIYALLHNPQVQTALGISLPDNSKVTSVSVTTETKETPK